MVGGFGCRVLCGRGVGDSGLVIGYLYYYYC
jgi:hypothetical protein